MRPRVTQELALLRRAFGEVDHAEADGNDWFRIQAYALPPGWTVNGERVTNVAVLFMVNPSYPTGEPYGFWAPAGLQFNGAVPNNVTEVENAAFGGRWTQFSWAPDESTWCTSAIVDCGSNLVDWARSFLKRLGEGL